MPAPAELAPKMDDALSSRGAHPAPPAHLPQPQECLLRLKFPGTWPVKQVAGRIGEIRLRGRPERPPRTAASLPVGMRREEINRDESK